MLGYEPPEPKFWKALFVTAPLVALFGWFIAGRLHIPRLFAWIIFGCAWVVCAATVHARVIDDWRAKYGKSLRSPSSR